ncbi:hypothetical protein CLCR_01738 [Cladophialophora carrionii]|uniref:Uncharacterized protein n=1 Tax=Cladophialophora carrionii TaxID=86049 RepID=A0A1C1CAH3_9EURO|nr:hypothetical protein CLCR_01738 [Cladophialophora carrionii]
MSCSSGYVAMQIHRCRHDYAATDGFSNAAKKFRLDVFDSLHAHGAIDNWVMPIGLNNIGWKMYIANGSWDIIAVVLIAVFWVETKGRTLEEIDAIFERHKHSHVLDVELVRRGKAQIDVGQVEQEIHTVVQATKLE